MTLKHCGGKNYSSRSRGLKHRQLRISAPSAHRAKVIFQPANGDAPADMKAGAGLVARWRNWAARKESIQAKRSAERRHHADSTRALVYVNDAVLFWTVDHHKYYKNNSGQKTQVTVTRDCRAGTIDSNSAVAANSRTQLRDLARRARGKEAGIAQAYRAAWLSGCPSHAGDDGEPQNQPV